MPRKSNLESVSDALKGWQQIAAFLGQPISVAQGWARSGMPVQRKGRYVYGSRQELSRWVGRESARGPVHIATEDTDLTQELKRGLSYVQKSGGKRGRAA